MCGFQQNLDLKQNRMAQTPENQLEKLRYQPIKSNKRERERKGIWQCELIKKVNYTASGVSGEADGRFTAQL